jgi:hypothetical protein
MLGVMGALVLLLPLAMTGLIGWQIVTGKLLDRSWRLWTTREARPTLFWLVVCIQSVVTIFVWSVFLREQW